MRILAILTLGLVLMTALSNGGSVAHLTAADTERLKALFVQNCSPDNDITSLNHAVQGLKLLGVDAGKHADKAALCTAVDGHADSASLETLYAASAAAVALGCPQKLKLGAKAAEVVKSGTSDGSTTASLYFAVNTLAATGAKLDSKAVLTALNSAIKKDDSLKSLGLAFHVAALLSGDVSKIYERIEDVIVQADTVDNKMMQFEGGLSVTSIVLTGAASLAAKAGKPLPVTADQAVMFATYLLSRKSVQQAKGALQLLEGVESMTGKLAQFTPVSVSLASSLAVQKTSPNVVISVLDLKGNPLEGDMKVTLDSIVSSPDGDSLATGVAMTKSDTAAGTYKADLMALKPAPGFYELTVSAKSSGGASAKLVGNQGVKLMVKVLVEAKITGAELKVIDSEAGGNKAHKLTYPQTTSGLALRQKDRLQLTFAVENAGSAKAEKLIVHQAFVKIAHVESGSEIIYVAESDSNDLYKFELDLDAEADLLKGSGKYTLTLMLGDPVVSNPISWLFGECQLDLTLGAPAAEGSPFQPKPEIKHLFREPEARPPQMVSTVFTLLCLSPVLILLILWFKLGANISNFSFSLSAIGFHLGLGAIFALYVMFWLELTMFVTMRYLAVIGVATFICGNSLLAGIAKKTSK